MKDNTNTIAKTIFIAFLLEQKAYKEFERILLKERKKTIEQFLEMSTNPSLWIGGAFNHSDNADVINWSKLNQFWLDKYFFKKTVYQFSEERFL